MLSANSLLAKLEYSQMKAGFLNVNRERLIKSGCVSSNENAFWLIDYWFNKDIRSFVQQELDHACRGDAPD